MRSDAQAELREVREVLKRVVRTARRLLHELEAVERIEGDSDRGAAVLVILARRLPQLRVVTDELGGESARDGVDGGRKKRG